MFAGLLLLATTAHAQTVAFDLNTPEARSLGIDTAAMERDVSTSVEKDLGLIDPTGYLHRFARAAAIASKGMGVDYASHPKVFSAGIALGTAVSGTPMSFSRTDDVPEGGFAFQASIHAGMNLGALDPKHDNLLDRFRIYASGLGLRAPSDNALQGRLFNFGLHGQVVILRPHGWGGAAEWGGLELTTGYERLQYELSLQHELPLSYQIQSFVTTWRANGDYAIATHVDSVPVELSTSMRATFLTLFGGVGVDFDIAGSTASGAMAGPVEVAVNRDPTTIGTGSVSMDGSGDANGGQFRGFFGFQFNIWEFKIYTHLNVGVDQTYGGFLGMRAAL